MRKTVVSATLAAAGVVASIGFAAPAAARPVPCGSDPTVVRVYSSVGVRCFDGVGSNPGSLPGVYRVVSGSHAGRLVGATSVTFVPGQTLSITPPQTVTDVRLTS
ncbi:hypothetical protein [Cryptosporangium japonicum]|uniref:Secreted protein n=1 Tax=Cryptosporangium japonicum TaxID=80872 RepID=A0ABN0UQH4_9ACTN